MKRLIFDYNPYCVRVALVENGELLEFSVERATMRGLVGNIYKGKVENVIDSMRAAFVNIGLERNGFLYVGDTLVEGARLSEGRDPKTVKVSPGDVIMCQVVKDQFGQKGARLTTDVSLPGAYLVLLPDSDFIGVSRKIEDVARRDYLEDLIKAERPQNTGFIVRSAADKASDDDIRREISCLNMQWQKIVSDFKVAPEKSVVFAEQELLHRSIRDTLSEDLDAIVVNDRRLVDVVKEELKNTDSRTAVELYDGAENVFVRYGISKQIDHLADRRVDMSNGAYLVVDKTEALTVIDVNTGKYVGSKDLEDTVYSTNLVAAETIAKTLRKRNISGIVVVDFIDMVEPKHRADVVEKLCNELKKDHMKTSAVEMTTLGLVELTRKKTRLPVDSFLLEECKDCKGGYVVSAEHLVFKLRDALIDYAKRHIDDDVIVATVNRAVFDIAFDTGYLSVQPQGYWKQKAVYLVPSDKIRRDGFELTSEKGEMMLPAEAKQLC